jgi:hypothetical protein
MHRILNIAFLSALILTTCKNNSANTQDNTLAKIEFKETLYEYGEIPYGSDGKCRFEFKNTSTIPLLINNVRTSCGCTNPVWPKEPISAGETGTIEVTYNTKITGSFRKSITVYANSDNSPITLHITGNVLNNDITK